MWADVAKISDVHAWEILDSRGNPTVRVTVTLSDGTRGTSSVPSGASTGIHEALELRDHDAKRYNGLGVLKAVHNANTVLRKSVLGMSDHRALDERMRDADGTENKSRLGANAILGVSLAAVHAGAASSKLPLYKYLRRVYGLPEKETHLPLATMNIVNGGRHADSGLSIQEFMIIPQQLRFAERVRVGSEVFHALQRLLRKKGFPALVGDEGGFAPLLGENEKALKIICEAIKAAGYSAGKDVALGLDFAASEFYDEKKKTYALNTGKRESAAEGMIKTLEKWCSKYPIHLVEDGLAQDDWDGWIALTKRLGKKVSLVGDDFFVTNTNRLQLGIDKRAANAILIKLNQIGTVTETIDCIQLAQRHGYKVIISNRSGETADTTIADLAVAVNSDYIKTGSLSRSERVEKYNRLMEIEHELASRAK